jgi:ribonuclease BN (tRNA processing enzyme)
LKRWFLAGSKEVLTLDVPLHAGGSRPCDATELSASLLSLRAPYKVAYATDGAAHAANREALLPLVRNADLFFAETCFLSADANLAESTKHFTAAFIGALARDAGVGELYPFHFSKRYVERAAEVLTEASVHFGRAVGNINAREEAPPPFC